MQRIKRWLGPEARPAVSQETDRLLRGLPQDTNQGGTISMVKVALGFGDRIRNTRRVALMSGAAPIIFIPSFAVFVIAYLHITGYTATRSDIDEIIDFGKEAADKAFPNHNNDTQVHENWLSYKNQMTSDGNSEIAARGGVAANEYLALALPALLFLAFVMMYYGHQQYLSFVASLSASDRLLVTQQIEGLSRLLDELEGHLENFERQYLHEGDVRGSQVVTETIRTLAQDHRKVTDLCVRVRNMGLARELARLPYTASHRQKIESHLRSLIKDYKNIAPKIVELPTQAEAVVSRRGRFALGNASEEQQEQLLAEFARKRGDNPPVPFPIVNREALEAAVRKGEVTNLEPYMIQVPLSQEPPRPTRGESSHAGPPDVDLEAGGASFGV